MPNVFGAVGTVRNFMNIVKEVDFDAVRGRAETPPSVLICATGEALAGEIVRQVFGEDAERHVDIRTQWFGDIDGSKYDVVVAIESGGSGLASEIRSALGADAALKLVVERLAAEMPTARELAWTRDAVVRANAELAPALGRRFPALRSAAVRTIIDDTAKANAQFALVSNIPAVVPVIGGIVAAGADFIVLTKNQAMMVFKLAAVYDRDLDNQFKVMRELAPVVGGGFLWRTVAREAVSFLPFAAGTIPKVVIAYIGTVVMGRAADYYYQFGKRPTADQIRAFTRRASETAARLQIGKGDDTGADDGSAASETEGPGRRTA